MPLVATRGAASAQGFGEFAVTSTPTYIEDVFSCFLYSGTGSSQTITNNIDLSTKGGLTWIKGRSGATGHRLTDTARGVTKSLESNSTAAEATESTGLTAFGTTGFTIGADADYNTSAATYVSWTFRKQPKFFDVVTWTGDGTGNKAIPHTLGSTPGCILFKFTNGGASDWSVYHTSLGTSQALRLNTTEAVNAASAVTAVSSSTFTVNSANSWNFSGSTYVAYLFAHNAGGFGLTGTDNVISCGSYTGTGAAGNAVTLGYEPQWLMVKKTTSATQSDWVIFDNMRGWPVAGSADQYLWANSINAEGSASTGWVSPNATGFQFDDGQGRTNGSGETYIYIAIRRGPMKVPTDATKVFYPYAASAPGNAVVTTGFPVDLQIQKNAGAGTDPRLVDRLRGVSTTPTSPSAAFPFLVSSDTTAESTGTGTTLDWGNTGFTVGNTYAGSAKAWAVNFRRAPGFFDEVCYTGTGSVQNITHNLTVVPELMITKERASGSSWAVYTAAVGATTAMYLNGTFAAFSPNSAFWNNTTPTASVFTVGGSAATGSSGSSFVAYLFATLAGVSKVGSYTGTGATQTINCGFTGGARFVLVKATSTTGNWIVADSARGIVAGNDPALYLNSTAAEVTGLDWIDADNSGFVVNETATIAANTNGVSYIFLAVA